MLHVPVGGETALMTRSTGYLDAIAQVNTLGVRAHRIGP